MELNTCTKELAEAINLSFERDLKEFLLNWVQENEEKTLLRFDQTIEEYLGNDVLRDFFLHTSSPVHTLLRDPLIAGHFSRRVDQVFFDERSGNPLLAPSEQRIYNLSRRMETEEWHVPFRSIHPNKQTESGDLADVSTYPVNCEEVRYNNGNYFVSRPANANVFEENGRRCKPKAQDNLHILYKEGYLEDRLQDVKAITAVMHDLGELKPQFFVICSRHSPAEGHYGVSLVVMDPTNPHYPARVLVCDTLLKELPQHPRWWNHFLMEYANVFGDGIVEIIEDLSHPLQKVNIKGDDPFRHDWNCPYYAASMAEALSDLINQDPSLVLEGDVNDIHQAMKIYMPDYYQADSTIKERQEIAHVNLLKRWISGSQFIQELSLQVDRQSSYEL